MSKTAKNTAKGSDERKLFIASLRDNLGVVTKALRSTGVSRKEYNQWLADDEEFRDIVEDIQEEQKDFVEARLLELIREGDTTATIFYSKTKLKDRGYSEKPVAKKEEKALVPVPAVEAKAIEAPKISADLEKKVSSKKKYIVKMLKEQGKYSVEMTAQATLVAQLMVKTEMLATEVLSSTHSPIQVELSREGNERATINASEKLYLEYVGKTQRALKALGMNMDSKAGAIKENDGFSDFMELMKPDDQ